MDSNLQHKIKNALEAYALRIGAKNSVGNQNGLIVNVKAALFDMDGILFDSMPRRADAWKRMCDKVGIDADRDEFFLYEGRTGASTIDLLVRRQFGREATEKEKKEFYALKSEFFSAMPAVERIAGAKETTEYCCNNGVVCVLVTGSGQSTLLNRLNDDFPDVFSADMRVTAHDVRYGKPHPEPFLAGLKKAGVASYEAVAIDNAPLGVQSASAAGIFTIGVRTGPVPQGTLKENGADIEVDSMYQCAEIIAYLKNLA